MTPTEHVRAIVEASPPLTADQVEAAARILASVEVEPVEVVAA